MPAMPSNTIDPRPSLARRGFLDLAGRGLLWLIGGAALSALTRYLTYQETAGPGRWLTLDHFEDYPHGGMTLASEAGVAIYRQADGFFARSLTCRHLGCHVQQADGGFACPCHGSRFDGLGRRLAGPAPSDLDGLRLGYDDDGRLVLDRLSSVDAGWRLPLPANLGAEPGAARDREG